jgi:predicted TIM-barrel fold metal-dependent hydrolase
MRGGFRVFDADTHIKPPVEAFGKYLPSSVRERISDLDEHRVPIRTGMAGEKYEPPYSRHLLRFASPTEGGWGRTPPRWLGEAGPRENAAREFQTFMGSRLPTDGGGDFDARIRLKDMDEEGSDVHFIVHTAGVGHPEIDLEMEFVRAEHRYMHEFCSADSSRLKSCVTVTPLDVEGSIAEIKRWGPERWAVAIHPKLPIDYPLDHPDLNPIWAAAADQGMAVIHHSFASGYPGYRDL